MGIGRLCRNEDRGAIVQILFNGLCNGALIALLAMAFVVVYLPTKVFYIALAGIYVLAAYLTKQLMAWGLPWPVAVIGALAAGVGVSLKFLEMLGVIKLESTQALADKIASATVVVQAMRQLALIHIGFLAALFYDFMHRK